MTTKNSTLTQARLKEVLDYNPETGVFRWRITVNRNKAHAGTVAGWIRSNGYLMISIDKKEYRAHRLAWLYIYGKWPENQIDHENQIRSCNAIKNLRDVTNAINCKNQRITKRNTSGITGVCWDKSRNKWLASIVVNYKQINLGRFEKIKDATRARKAAERKYGFHPNHGKTLI